jgi:hypothetical protein
VKVFTSYAVCDAYQNPEVSPKTAMTVWSVAPDGDVPPTAWGVPLIWVMTREAPLAEHQVKPLNLEEHAQEATAKAV